MKRRDFLACGCLLVCGANAAEKVGADGGSEHILEVCNKLYAELKEFQIDDPGKYMLDSDQIQKARFRAGDGFMRPSRGYMLVIYCGFVELDLRGHVLGAEAAVSGVALISSMNRYFAESRPKRFGKASLDNRFVLLRHGTIDMARGELTGLGVNFATYWYEQNLLTKGRPVLRRGSPAVIEYERSEYRFENLKVLANNVAMVVEGTHTVIRDCVIESADKAAIFIAGDHVTIENCDIRMRRSWRENTLEPRAAIVLRDGANAIIRNNRIRIDEDDGMSEPHAIVVRDGARDVLVEGNTFINVKGEPVTLTEGAQATVRDNRFERRWF